MPSNPRWAYKGLDMCKLYDVQIPKPVSRWGKSPSRKHLWDNYRLTLDDFWELVNSQNGECKICGIFKGNRLVVDHEHGNGKVRGLLCSSCNTGLGQFGDDEVTLLKAVFYLKRSRKQ